MVKEKRILSYFLGWLITGFLLIFIGINNVFANTIDYENIGMLSDYTVFYSQDTSSNPEFQELTQYEYYNLMNVSAFLLDIDTFEFKSGVIYDLELYLPANSVKNNVNFIVTDSNYNQCTTYELFIEDEHYPRFRFSCPSDTIGIDMYIYNDSEDYVINNGNFSWHYTYLRKQVSTVDLGPIIDQNNQIIQGQEEIKDTIKDELNSCRDSYNLFNVTDYRNLNISNNNASLIIKNEIQVDVSTSSTGNYSGFWIPYTYIPGYIDGYNSNKTYYISFDVHSTDTMKLRYGSDIYTTATMGNTKTRLSIQTSISQGIIFYAMPGLDDATFYISNIMISETNSTKFEKYGEQICFNKIDETNKELGDINNALTDDSSPNLDGLADSAGWLPPGPLDSVLNLPLSLFNSLTINLNKSCSPISIPLPYVNENLTIPCINTLYDSIGVSTFITWLGVIVSGLMLYTYLLKLYKWIEDRISLNETHSVDNWGGL